MRIEILGFDDCPNYRPAVELARAAVRNAGARGEIHEVKISGPGEAETMCFLGSPSVLVNGLDVEPAVRDSKQFGFGCRTYLVNGTRQSVPPQEWIERTIREALAAKT